MPSYNLKNPSVKRVLKEAREMHQPSQQYFAQPLEENIFEWHFTIRGPQGTAFEDGIYHGRIVLPSDYPFKPPSIILLTPNGRFEVGKKICLSISAHHPEYWRPSWSIRTVLLALISYMPAEGMGSIGALDYNDDERTILAKRSLNYVCPTCERPNHEIVLPKTEEGDNEPLNKIDAEAISQISFAPEKKKTPEDEKESAAASTSKTDDNDSEQSDKNNINSASNTNRSNIGNGVENEDRSLSPTSSKSTSITAPASSPSTSLSSDSPSSSSSSHNANAIDITTPTTNNSAPSNTTPTSNDPPRRSGPPVDRVMGNAEFGLEVSIWCVFCALCAFVFKKAIENGL